MSRATYEPTILATPFTFRNSIHRNDHVYSHWHESIEFLCCVEGECEVNISSNVIPMNIGDTVVVNSRRIHGIFTKKFVNYYCLIVSKNFFTENGIDINKLAFSETFSDNKAFSLMKEIFGVYKNKNDEFSVAERRNAIFSYILYVSKNHSLKKDTASTHDSKKYDTILDAIDFINAHLTEKLTLDEIAEQAGYSKYHFSRLFKEFTGFTVIEHLNDKRCERAASLLTKTDKPISEIRYECGFECGTYFARIFKKIYKYTPSEYRNLYTKK